MALSLQTLPDKFVQVIASTGSDTQAGGTSASIKDSDQGGTVSVSISAANPGVVTQDLGAAFAGTPVGGAGGDIIQISGVLYHIKTVSGDNKSLTLYEAPGAVVASLAWGLGGRHLTLTTAVTKIKPSSNSGNGAEDHVFVDPSVTDLTGITANYVPTNNALTSVAKMGRPVVLEGYGTTIGDGSRAVSDVAAGSTQAQTFSLTATGWMFRHWKLQCTFTAVPAGGWRGFQSANGKTSLFDIWFNGTAGATLTQKTAGANFTSTGGNRGYMLRGNTLYTPTGTLTHGQLMWPAAATNHARYWIGDTNDPDLGGDNCNSQARMIAHTCAKCDGIAGNSALWFGAGDSARSCIMEHSLAFNSTGATQGGIGLTLRLGTTRHENATALRNVTMNNVIYGMYSHADSAPTSAHLVTGNASWGDGGVDAATASGKELQGSEEVTLLDTAAVTWTLRNLVLTSTPYSNLANKDYQGNPNIKRKTDVIGGDDSDGRYLLAGVTPYLDLGPIDTKTNTGWFMEHEDDTLPRHAGAGGLALVGVVAAGLAGSDAALDNRRSFFRKALATLASAIGGR